ncbi:L,D-transpeptidase [Candidatus Villigracilis saccharophilus]|uniref:L,D-transpeptidase n=1 Tax=Candidatus Villigracilis saccharophilus TaxID=3140684 RepID=UPI003136D40D|nr:L,D-transpeptidase [Anaerolineales bacterium]
MIKNIQLSRRDFLKISASGALAFVLSEMGFDRALAAPPASQGRITWSGIPLYDAPTFKANELHLFGIDKVISLKAEVQGDESFGNSFNRIWYEVDGGGYVFSGGIQPVETNYQKAVYEIPEAGQLGEICVPMSLTHLAPYTYAKNGHRLYYGSTHWIKRVVVTREEKSVWYEIFDDELKKSFYVPSFNMRLIPDDELTMLSPQVPAADKLIHIDIATQMVTAFEGEKMVLSARCSSGQRGTDTPKGEFSTFHKWPSRHMTNQGDAVQNVYNLPGVPWCSFFTGMGHAIHGTYWHNDYGRPRSHGCINLPSELSKWIYRWSNPLVPPEEDYLNLPGAGTRVLVV